MCFTKNSYIIKTCHRGVAQSGSVFVWGAKGRGFESRHSDQNKKYHNVVFFVLLWCHDLNTINCNAISGSTSSRFCKHKRGEIVTITPQGFARGYPATPTTNFRYCVRSTQLRKLSVAP